MHCCRGTGARQLQSPPHRHRCYTLPGRLVIASIDRGSGAAVPLTYKGTQELLNIQAMVRGDGNTPLMVPPWYSYCGRHVTGLVASTSRPLAGNCLTSGRSLFGHADGWGARTTMSGSADTAIRSKP